MSKGHCLGIEKVEFDELNVVANAEDDELLAIHEALDGLAAEDPAVAKLVKLRFFAGLSIDEAALALDVSRSTAKRHWNYAKAWLYQAVRKTQSPN